MSKPLKISSASTEYVEVKVTYMVNGVVADPTNNQVKMAFISPDTDPQESDWKTANWEATPGKYTILSLVGPGSPSPLADGFYTVWIRMVANPENIVKRAGSLTIE